MEPTQEQIEKYLANDARCLFCESQNIEGGPVEVDSGGAWQPISCTDCEAEWNDVYQLVGVGEAHAPDKKEN